MDISSYKFQRTQRVDTRSYMYGSANSIQCGMWFIYFFVFSQFFLNFISPISRMEMERKLTNEEKDTKKIMKNHCFDESVCLVFSMLFGHTSFDVSVFVHSVQNVFFI